MRRGALALGGLALAAVWGGPLLGGDPVAFSGVMLAHVGVVAVAAPLLAVWLAGTRLPVPVSPIGATLLDVVVIWGWHAPALRDAAAASPAVLAAEQASFLAVGLALWISCLRAGAAGVAGLLFTSMHMTLLGALLALTPRPLYGDAPVTCLGVPLGPLADQQLGGTLMLAAGGAVYLAGGLALMAGLLRRGDAGRA